MTLHTGRILKRADAGAARPMLPSLPQQSRYGRREPAAFVAAADRARRILERAEAQAAAVRREASRDAAEARLAAEEAGRAEGAAAVAAWAAHLAKQEAALDERALDRLASLSRIVAERILGHVLASDPAEVVALARQALLEARGARRITLAANPEDVPLLRDAIGAGQELDLAVNLEEDPGLARGDLRLETELGTLDARIGPQLDRLTRRLRASLTR